MSLNSPFAATVLSLLSQLDVDLATEARALGCPVQGCGGRLHCANFDRKPRGANFPDDYGTRFSFCCNKDGCRSRVTPPSLRFLGRKVYAGIVVVLVSALRHGVTDARARALRRATGVSRETLARWHHWWTRTFVATPFWDRARAMLRSPVSHADLPGALLSRFAGADAADQATRLLAFIKPITTTSARHMERISMGV